MTAVYGARSVKRARATKAQMQHRREVLYDIVQENQPVSVRGAYYRAVCAGIVPKTEQGYRQVQRALAEMREVGDLPFAWIVDNGRRTYTGRSYDSVGDYLAAAASSYRRALWSDAPAAVEVWAESDSIAGTVADPCDEWDVPLMPTKGYPSKTFVWAAAQTFVRRDRPVFVYYLGDLDPAGIDIERTVREGLHRHAPETMFTFERVAVTFDQRDEWDLPTTPAKHRANVDFYGGAVEVEAVPPPTLRSMLEDRIFSHFDQRRLEVLLIAEDEERQLLERMAAGVGA